MSSTNKSITTRVGPSTKKGKRRGRQPKQDEEKLHRLVARAISLNEQFRRMEPPNPGGPAPLVTARTEPGTLQSIGREADMAWGAAKRIMAMLNVEEKHVYYGATNAQATQVGTVLDLSSLISQGVGGNQRTGDSLKMKRVKGKFVFLHNASQGTNGAFTVVIGHSKDGVPAVSDVFAVQSQSYAGLAFPLDTYDQADKWSKSKFACVDAYNPTCAFELEVPFNHDVLYTNASTTASSGAVWLAFISNEPTNYPSLSMQLDISFVDN